MTDRFTSCDRCERTIERREAVQITGIDFCRRCADYCSEFLDRDPWPDNAITWLLPTMEEVDRLADELERTVSQAQDAKPLEKFFERNPSFLVQLFRYGHGRWVFPRPRLGSEHIPDFAVCGLDSAGPHWHLVELESPTCPVLRQDGQPREEFTRAVNRVSDWRIWLRKNVQYAQGELGYLGLDSEFKGVIVMGRRYDISPEHRERYRELPRGGIEVMSYDRVLEQVVGNAKGWRASRDGLLQAQNQEGVGQPPLHPTTLSRRKSAGTLFLEDFMRYTEEEIVYTRERRFFLNTTFDFFADKLNRYTQGVSSQSFPMEKGRMILQPARRGHRPLTIEMEGLYSIIVEEAERVCGVGPVISFEAIQLSDERLEVIARCEQPAVLSYFEELMEEIERCWPEVREQREGEPARFRAEVEELLEEIEDEETAVPDWVPTQQKALERWKKAYPIIIEMEEEYYELYLDAETNSPKPWLKEYNQRLLRVIDREYTLKTIQRIKQAGMRGWI